MCAAPLPVFYGRGAYRIFVSCHFRVCVGAYFHMCRGAFHGFLVIFGTGFWLLCSLPLRITLLLYLLLVWFVSPVSDSHVYGVFSVCFAVGLFPGWGAYQLGVALVLTWGRHDVIVNFLLHAFGFCLGFLVVFCARALLPSWESLPWFSLFCVNCNFAPDHALIPSWCFF